MKIKKFEDIISWQKARVQTKLIYTLFKTNKDYSFKDQIQRASISIMNNIAEGFERNSDKEFIRFLYIARGSSGEVRSMLYLGKDLEYITKEKFDELYNQSLEITKLIFGLIRSLREASEKLEH